MEKHKQEMKMTDDILDKFLSGEATKEEKNAVMEYMTESDEHLDELMCITEAIREHREIEKPKSKPKIIYYRVASVVAVVIIGVSVWFPRHGWNGYDGDVIAEQNIPIDVKNLPESNSSNNYYQIPENSSHPKRELAMRETVSQNENLQEEFLANNSFEEKTYCIQMRKTISIDPQAKNTNTPMAASRSKGYKGASSLSTTNEWYFNPLKIRLRKESMIVSWKSNAPTVWIVLKTMDGEIMYVNKYSPEIVGDTISSNYWEDEKMMKLYISAQNGNENLLDTTFTINLKQGVLGEKQ